MTHRHGHIAPHHHCSQQTNNQLSLRVNTTNPNHHLYNNNGTWYVHYTVCEQGCSGQRRRESLGTHDVKEARRLRDRLLGHRPTTTIPGGEA